MLIAPTEPPEIKALGRTSAMPERFGVDVLMTSPGGLVGVQRKERSDFLASIHDGRLAKEMAQMGQLRNKVLLLEGKWHWTADGALMDSRQGQYGWRWTQQQHWGMLWSVRLRGVWVDYTDSLDATVRYLGSLRAWASKEAHKSLRARPSKRSAWGHRRDKDWAVWVLSGFDGLSEVRAGRVFDHFGELPLRWSFEEFEELAKVKGIGKPTARRLWEALNG